MRSFTNKNGEKVFVTEEHLRTAVRIKKELQNASPSRRCNWALLAQLMAQEGFPEAENSEAYRCLVKDFQREIGELPSAPKYAEMVTDGKLESIKQLVGEIAYEKRENQQVLRELNKVKREVIDFTLTAELIGNAFKNYDFTALQFDNQPSDPVGGKKMVVCLSDLHIGAIVENEFNTYNFEVAKNRLQQYLHKVINECKLHNIEEVFVINLGDVIEHSYMHNISYNTEFTMSEQIVRATDLIIKFLVGLAEHVSLVRYAGTVGNHDRLHESKDKNLHGDHVVKPINYAIQQFIENAKIKNIVYEQSKEYSHSFEMNGKNILALHGDLDKKNDPNLLAKHSALNGVNYDIILMGHYHCREIKEVGNNKFICICGSLKGVDDYSLNKLRKMSSPSQTYLIIHEDGEVEFKWATMN